MCASLMSDLQGPTHNVPALAQPLVYFPLPEVASHKGDPNRMFGGQGSDVYRTRLPQARQTHTCRHSTKEHNNHRSKSQSLVLL